MDLSSVQDHKEVLSGNCFLRRIKPARLYAKKAGEALDDVKVSRKI